MKAPGEVDKLQLAAGDYRSAVDEFLFSPRDLKGLAGVSLKDIDLRGATLSFLLTRDGWLSRIGIAGIEEGLYKQDSDGSHSRNEAT